MDRTETFLHRTAAFVLWDRGILHIASTQQHKTDRNLRGSEHWLLEIYDQDKHLVLQNQFLDLFILYFFKGKDLNAAEFSASVAIL